MNKKELVKALMNRMQNFGYFPSFTNVKTFIKEYEKLTNSEPEIPVVPQFVADWYEENKDDFETNLFTLVYKIFKKRNDNELTEIENWLIDEHTKPFSTLVNMHQFGYEVEKEKRYTVKFKNIQEHHSFLNFSIKTEKWLFSIPEGDTLYRTHHTRKELEEANFGWVFDCPGIQIEEVE